MSEYLVSEPLRVVLYSHDSQGLGHFRRNRALAGALARRLPVLTGRPATGLLVNGVTGASGATLPTGFDVVTLPAITKTPAGYAPRHLTMGLSAATGLRSAVIRATLSSFAPDLVIVDRHPLGVEGELAPALAELRADHPATRVVLGLRDVLDERATVAAEWRRTPVGVVRELFDEIWCYGDAAVHDLRRTGELPEALHDLVRYQGYLSRGRVLEADDLHMDRPYLVTTAGGGRDGTALCLAAAATEVPPGFGHLVVTGPQMSEGDHLRVLRAAGPLTQVVRSVPDAAGLIRGAAASVSMAGYNTVTETMATDVPALLVPRETPRREQLIRATGLAAVGAADVLRQDDLTPTALRAWWRSQAGRRTDRSHLDLGGLGSVARATTRLTAPRPDAYTAGGLRPVTTLHTHARQELRHAV